MIYSYNRVHVTCVIRCADGNDGNDGNVSGTFKVSLVPTPGLFTTVTATASVQ